MQENLTDAAWRAYDNELTDLFLQGDFSAGSPPSVISLLLRDNVIANAGSIPPAMLTGVRKVDRYAPASAAIIASTRQTTHGYGRQTDFTHIQHTPMEGFDEIAQLTSDARCTFSQMTRSLYALPGSLVRRCLDVFDDRTRNPIIPFKPGEKHAYAHHILAGGDLETLQGLLRNGKRLLACISSEKQRRDSYHQLVVADMVRASVHMEVMHASPTWQNLPGLQLVRSGPNATLRTPAGTNPWRPVHGSERTDTSPRLKCPAHQDNLTLAERMYGISHPAQTALRDLEHAVVNEGFRRGVL